MRVPNYGKCKCKKWYGQVLSKNWATAPDATAILGGYRRPRPRLSSMRVTYVGSSNLTAAGPVKRTPLLDTAADILSPTLNDRSATDLAALLIQLRARGSLCHQPSASADARIVAAIGFMQAADRRLHGTF